jgi:hypothetical protein
VSRLLLAAQAVLSWHAKFPTHAAPQCPRMPDGRALACRCSELCPHEQLRLAVLEESNQSATVNRYCRAGMCVPSDAGHEPWCLVGGKPANTESTSL